MARSESRFSPCILILAERENNLAKRLRETRFEISGLAISRSVAEAPDGMKIVRFEVSEEQS